MKRIVDTFFGMAALAVAAFVFVYFDVEGMLLKREAAEPVSAQELESATTEDYTGMPGGNGVTALRGIGQWDALIPELDYVTVTPRAVYETDVFTLAKWEGFFNTRVNGTTGSRRSEVVKGWLHMPLVYRPVYVIELEDGSHVLAQMNRCYAKQIRKGVQVTLPLGTKRGMLNQTRALLKDDMAAYKTPDDYLLYTMNDAWQGRHANGIFIGKLAVSAIVGMLFAVVLLMVSDKLFAKREST